MRDISITYKVHTRQFHFKSSGDFKVGSRSILPPLLSELVIDAIPRSLFPKSIWVCINLPRPKGSRVEEAKSARSFPLPCLCEPEGWIFPIVNTDPDGCGTSHLARCRSPSSASEEEESSITSSIDSDNRVVFELLSALSVDLEVDGLDSSSSRSNSHSFVLSF